MFVKKIKEEEKDIATKTVSEEIVAEKNVVEKNVAEKKVNNVVIAKVSDIKVYGLVTKSYNIGGIKVNITKDKYTNISRKIFPLLQGLKVIKKA